VINPVKLFVGTACVALIFIGALFSTGYLSGRAWALIGIGFGLVIFFMVTNFRKSRKKGATINESLTYAIKKTFLEWFR
jgi:lipopolysaccharide export LptBFGC system permease protein LptF